MNNPIDNTGIFDSRDLTEYRDFLLDELLSEANDEFEQEFADVDELQDYLNDLDEPDCYKYQDEIKEFNDVNDFCNELEGYGDFSHGETIISEDYFTEYCEELVKELGYLSTDLPSFIETNINWDGVASDLKIDYMQADFDGTAYFMRA